MPSAKNYFLSIEEYLRYFPNLTRVNCLATSFLRTYNIEFLTEIVLSSCMLDTTKEIGESYLTKADDLKEYNGYGREAFRRITSLEEFEASHAQEFRLVYGHQKCKIERNVFGCRYMDETKDFHVIIGVRDDAGKVRWYHKFGVSRERPREVTSDDWAEIKNKYVSNPPALFEFEEPER